MYYPRLVWNALFSPGLLELQRFSCLSRARAGIIDVHHHAEEGDIFKEISFLCLKKFFSHVRYRSVASSPLRTSWCYHAPGITVGM
jgi:hypothetical protein